jgi:RNA ligase
MAASPPPTMRKYPRTRHIEGSRLGPGDEDLEAVPFAELAGKVLVVEEKMDGANAAISFDGAGKLWLQSRGHFLTGGAREKHFAALKPWAHANADALRERLGDRHVMYGEWLFAKHTVYYDALPHHFLEFDILDLEAGVFLSTARRRALLDGAPVTSVPVLADASFRRQDALVALVGRSNFKSPTWRERLAETAHARELDVDRVLRETDPSDEMEGLYVKVEEAGCVTGRYKWVRKSFLTSVVDSGTHWLSRPIVPNGLAP